MADNWDVDAVIRRCGCTEQQKQSPDFHALRNEPCPNPAGVELANLGLVTVSRSTIEG